MNDAEKQIYLAEIAALKAQVVDLQSRLDELLGVPSLVAGIHGEALIAQLVNGQMTIHTAPHDIVVTNGHKLEVKYSRLNIPNRLSNARRWSWNHPTGQKRLKDYTHLLLIGDADPRYRHAYKDPSSRYVVFDVPREAVDGLNQNDNHISITTDPNRTGAETTRIKLFRDFQTSLKELKQRYGLHRKPRNG